MIARRIEAGDVMVPRGCAYPHGAIRVSKRVDEYVEFSAEGGGFVKRAPAALLAWDFRRCTTEEMSAPPLVKAEFTLDGMYEADERVTGWHDGSRWNGWAVPLFERESLLRLVKLLDGTWDEETKTATFIYDGDEESATRVELRPNPRLAGVEVGGFDGWCFYEYEADGSGGLRPDERAKQVAAAFSRRVRECIEANLSHQRYRENMKARDFEETATLDDVMNEIRRRNETPEYKRDGLCASHDFCDPNVSMMEAFAEVLGDEDGDGQRLAKTEAEESLWQEAWDLAKAGGFR